MRGGLCPRIGRGMSSLAGWVVVWRVMSIGWWVVGEIVRMVLPVETVVVLLVGFGRMC